MLRLDAEAVLLQHPPLEVGELFVGDGQDFPAGPATEVMVPGAGDAVDLALRLEGRFRSQPDLAEHIEGAVAAGAQPLDIVEVFVCHKVKALDNRQR